MHNMLYLIGRLVDNPVIEDDSEDKKVSNIVIAVQRAWKNEEGIYETDFFECTLINGIAENVVNYCKKDYNLTYYMIISLISLAANICHS